MRKLIFIIAILSSCQQPEPARMMTMTCLRDYLIDEDAGGDWEVVTEPTGSNLILTGDNPCFDWDDYPCGQYELRYIVGDTCCRDTSVIMPLRCCLEGISTCN